MHATRVLRANRAGDAGRRRGYLKKRDGSSLPPLPPYSAFLLLFFIYPLPLLLPLPVPSTTPHPLLPLSHHLSPYLFIVLASGLDLPRLPSGDRLCARRSALGRDAHGTVGRVVRRRAPPRRQHDRSAGVALCVDLNARRSRRGTVRWSKGHGPMCSAHGLVWRNTTSAASRPMSRRCDDAEARGTTRARWRPFNHPPCWRSSPESETVRSRSYLPAHSMPSVERRLAHEMRNAWASRRQRPSRGEWS